MFSSRSFIVSGLMFRSLIHFEFIFVYGVRKCSSFIILQVVDQFSQHHLFKSIVLCLLVILKYFFPDSILKLVNRGRWRDTAGGGAASSWFLCAFFLLQCCAFCVWHNVCLLCAFFLLQCWANMQDIQWSSPSLTFSSTPVEVFSAPIAFPAVTAAVPPKAVCR